MTAAFLLKSPELQKEKKKLLKISQTLRFDSVLSFHCPVFDISWFTVLKTTAVVRLHTDVAINTKRSFNNS